MKEFICLYEVEHMFDDKTQIDRGLLFANNFIDAVEQLENTLYGVELVKINYLELFDGLPTFPENLFNQIKDYFNSNMEE